MTSHAVPGVVPDTDVLSYACRRPRIQREDVCMASCTLASNIYQAALQTSVGLPYRDVSYMLLVLMAPLETNPSLVSGDAMEFSQGLCHRIIES